MTYQRVEAVLYWRYSKSTFKAVYGRFGPDTGYTKDYLQASGSNDVYHKLFPGLEPKQEVPVTYKWPGGQATGTVRYATDGRLNVAWVPTGIAPRPWRLSADAPDRGNAVIPGEPKRTTHTEANEEFEALSEKGVEPWLVAVKLVGEDATLHTRTYLRNPPAGFEHTSTELLPSAVRRGIETMQANVSSGSMLASEAADVSPLTQRLLSTLERTSNVLLVGPPGTGKTVALNELADLYNGDNQILFDPDRYQDAWSLSEYDERRALSVAFHPSYSYEQFVASLEPKPAESGGFTLTATPGPLLFLAHWASKAGNGAALICDEFNRGNPAAIFGDFLALLDDDKRYGSNGPPPKGLIRPFPSTPMVIPEKYSSGPEEPAADEILLPSSLKIVAALNSSDRTVAPIDAAVRRRFAIIDVGPDYEIAASHLGVSAPQGPWSHGEDPSLWSREAALELSIRVLHALNERIELVLGRDFLLGQAAIWSVGGQTAEEVLHALSAAFDERIARSLALTFQDQDEELGAILRCPRGESNVGRVGEWLEVPPELSSVASPRLRLRQLSLLGADAAGLCFVRLL